jgi:hypothetical protein
MSNDTILGLLVTVVEISNPGIGTNIPRFRETRSLVVILSVCCFAL